MSKFVCTICGYTHEGAIPPEKCPVCLSSASEFSVIEETTPEERVKNETEDSSNNNANPIMDGVEDTKVKSVCEENSQNRHVEEICDEGFSKKNEQISKEDLVDPEEEEILSQYDKTQTKLQVVRGYKEKYNVGLKEAKDRVESVLVKHNLCEVGKSGSGCVITVLVAITSTLSLFVGRLL